MNRKGFTLVELLAVIVILGIISTIAVASVNKINENTKNRLLNTKISLFENNFLSWAQDNESCFTGAGIDCLTMTCTTTNGLKNCIVTYNELASKHVVKYDNDDNQIINPANNKVMNNSTIKIEYNPNNRSFTIVETTVNNT